MMWNTRAQVRATVDADTRDCDTIGAATPLHERRGRAWKKTCAQCLLAKGDDAEAFQTCSACHEVRYCGKACQVQAWADHKANCKVWKRERRKRKQKQKKIRAAAAAAVVTP
jgi:hypothetical protein